MGIGVGGHALRDEGIFFVGGGHFRRDGPGYIVRCGDFRHLAGGFIQDAEGGENGEGIGWWLFRFLAVGAGEDIALLRCWIGCGSAGQTGAQRGAAPGQYQQRQRQHSGGSAAQQSPIGFHRLFLHGWNVRGRIPGRPRPAKRCLHRGYRFLRPIGAGRPCGGAAPGCCTGWGMFVPTTGMICCEGVKNAAG